MQCRGESPSLSLLFPLWHRGVGWERRPGSGIAPPAQPILSGGADSGTQVGDREILTACWLSGLTQGPSAVGGRGCVLVTCAWLSEHLSV